MKFKSAISIFLSIVLAFSCFSGITLFASATSESIRYGDIDADGEITSNDALMALQFSVNKTELTADQVNIGNVDGTGDGTSATDALYILQYSVNKILIFPIEDNGTVPTVTPTVISGIEVNDVYKYGAVGDGVADDTNAFKAAIYAAENNGLPVYVPAGTFLINDTLTMKHATLYGYDNGAWAADGSDLPLIIQNDSQKVLFQLVSSSISGVQILVKGVNAQTTSAAATVTLAKPGCRVSNVKIQNPYIGIDMDPTITESNPGRLVLEDIFIIQAWHIGVRTYGTRDVPTLCNIEVWNNNIDYPCPNAFVFGDNDDLRAVNLFAFNAAVGFLFDTSFLKNVSGCWGSFVNCSVDFTQKGIRIAKGDHHITFTGGTYWTHFNALEILNTTGDETAVVFSGCELQSNANMPCVKIGGGKLVTVTGCNVLRNNANNNDPAFLASGGKIVTISGNSILVNGNYLTIDIAFPKKSALNFSGNTIATSLTEEEGGFTNPSRCTNVSTENNVIIYEYAF